MAHINLNEQGDVTKLLRSWRHRARLNQKAHYAMAHRTARFAFWFGTGAAILSGVVGILILVAARSNPSPQLLITIAAVSIVSSVITTIATSAKWSDKASQHHSAGAAFGVVHRRIELALALPPQSNETARELTETLRAELDELPMKAPPIPDHIWRALPKDLTPALAAIPDATNVA
jgi:hypothetical protein